MKKILSILFILFAGLCMMPSCSDDDPSGTIFPDPEPGSEALNFFDIWLNKTLRDPLNITYQYKYKDIETDMLYNVVPARMDESIKLVRLLRLLWLDPYERTLNEFPDAGEYAGMDFLRRTTPKLIVSIGSGAYNNNNSMILGQAELGLKITLYKANDLSGLLNDLEELSDPERQESVDRMNEYFFQTMHHEFAHILHQSKDIPADFKDVSRGLYVQDQWLDFNGIVSETLAKGFVTAYGRSDVYEDFVETLAVYVVNSDERWESWMVQAGPEGRTIIERKLDIIKDWVKKNWKYDLEVLHRHVRNAYDRIENLDLDTLDTEIWDNDINY